MVERFKRELPKDAKEPERVPEDGPQNNAQPLVDDIEKGAAMNVVVSTAMADEFAEIMKTATQEKESRLGTLAGRTPSAAREVAEEGIQAIGRAVTKARPKPKPAPKKKPYRFDPGAGYGSM